MIESLQNVVFLSRVPILSVCDDSSVIILKIHKTGEKNSQVFRNRASTASGKRVTLASHKISRMFPREQRQRESKRERVGRQRESEPERGRESMCVLVVQGDLRLSLI